AQTGRPEMFSPGRPGLSREFERRFWVEVAKGLSTDEAAAACGVSSAVGSRWFRHSGGMPLFDLSPPSGRYLSFSEREEIALQSAQKVGVREIARCLERSPSTISRELKRNAATRCGQLIYRASTAQSKAELAATRPKASKLAVNQRLRAYVQERLAGLVTAPNGTKVAGPKVAWIGRRH